MPGEIPRTASDKALSTSVIQAGQSMCDGQSKEYFWGCTLTSASNSVTWSTDEEDADEERDEDFLQHSLFLRHAMLGAGAPTDRHIVELETKDHNGDTIKLPILSLKMGLNEMVGLDLNFPNGIAVTLRLIEGAGPVHISGQQLIEFPDEEEDEEEALDDTALTEEEEAVEDEAEAEGEDEEDEEEDEEEETDGKKKASAKATKRKASITKGSKKAKKGRRDRSVSEEGSEEEEEEEEEEAEESMEEEEDDEDYEEEKKGKKGKPKGKGARVVKKTGQKPAAGKKGKKAKA